MLPTKYDPYFTDKMYKLRLKNFALIIKLRHAARLLAEIMYKKSSNAK